MRYLFIVAGTLIITTGISVQLITLEARVEKLEKRQPAIVLYEPEIPATDYCLEKIANYHGVNGLRINQDGSIDFKRDGKWLRNHYVPPGCEPDETEKGIPHE